MGAHGSAEGPMGYRAGTATGTGTGLHRRAGEYQARGIHGGTRDTDWAQGTGATIEVHKVHRGTLGRA